MAEALYENLQDLISKEEFENKKLQRLIQNEAEKQTCKSTSLQV